MDFSTANSRRWIRYGVGALAAGLLVALFPPFHVRTLTTPDGKSRVASAGFDAAAAARKMWEQEIPAVSARAIDANELVASLAADPDAAARLGRRIGLGGKVYFFVRGTGRVSSVDSAGVHLSIAVPRAEVLLKTGPVFGNALRDAPGLFDINARSTFDANALSAELNHIAETSVQPGLLGLASPGKNVRFTGCGEASEANGVVVLKLIAITAEAMP